MSELIKSLGSNDKTLHRNIRSLISLNVMIQQGNRQ
jgi:hypothetical protein